MGTTPDDCCDGLYCGFKSAYDAVINKGYCDYKTKPCSRYRELNNSVISTVDDLARISPDERCHVSMGTTPDNCCNGLTCQFANAQDAVLNHGYCAYPKNV